MNLFSTLFLKTLLSAVYRIKTRLFRPKSEATAQSFSYLRFIKSIDSADTAKISYQNLSPNRMLQYGV